MPTRSPYDGNPYYCAVCGVPWYGKRKCPSDKCLIEGPWRPTFRKSQHRNYDQIKARQEQDKNETRRPS